MKNNFIIFITIICCCLFTCPANTIWSEESVKDIEFASEAWAHATEEDGTGLYWDIFRAIYEPEGIRVSFLIRSYADSVNLIKEKGTDAMVGAYAHEVTEGIYPKHHFAVDVVQAITRKSSVKWQGQQTMQGNKVGWIKGYSYDGYLIVPVDKIELNSREAAFSMLDTGRLDYFLDAAADITEHLKLFRLSPESYSISTFMKLKLYVVFSDNAKGKTLSEIFDRRFEELLKSGDIKEMYEIYINDKKARFTNPFN